MQMALGHQEEGSLCQNLPVSSLTCSPRDESVLVDGQLTGLDITYKQKQNKTHFTLEVLTLPTSDDLGSQCFYLLIRGRWANFSTLTS